MVKTGNTFIDYILVLMTFLPLALALFIIFQKDYSKAPLTILMILCLLDFIKSFSSWITLLDSPRQNILINILSLLELLLLVRLFRDIFGKRMRNILNIFQVAFMSSLFTFFTLKGWGQSNIILDSLLNGTLIGIILLSLPLLVRERGLLIFSSPLFWIASGTLFYFLISLLLEWVDVCCHTMTGASDREGLIFLSIAALIRYLLYLFAILVTHKNSLLGQQEHS